MNEDYLWDKSGEPDPEIEQLENTLGRLRYKPPAEPLPLPAASRWSSRLSFSPALAIAATLLLLLLAGGLWLGLQRRSSSTEGKQTLATGNAPEEKRNEQTVSDPRPPLGPTNLGDERLAVDGNKSDTVAPSLAVPRNKLPRRFSGARQVVARYREVAPAPRREQIAREGAHAKAQLILALHIASDKLNTVQRKIQANPGT
ncbi:MAG: hypothetical protein QOH25_3913 [Acidobacteriota bacterium]|jgi:hypothetical protein|nr:hypothetical protein [Acidobacteriota bacterium]